MKNGYLKVCLIFCDLTYFVLFKLLIFVEFYSVYVRFIIIIISQHLLWHRSSRAQQHLTYIIQ